MNVYIPRDMQVKVTLDGALIFAAVRHCSPLAQDFTSFKVGIEIETVIVHRHRFRSKGES